MNRLIASSALSVLVVFALFLFMVSLVQVKSIVHTKYTYLPSISFIPKIKDIVKPPHIKKPIKKVVKTPPKAAASVKPNKMIQVPNTHLTVDGILPLGQVKQIDFTGLNTIGNRKDGNDRSLTPKIRVRPMYPRPAAAKHMEGWVKLSYSVNKDGSVSDVNVVASKPKHMFERSAIEA